MNLTINLGLNEPMIVVERRGGEEPANSASSELDACQSSDMDMAPGAGRNQFGRAPSRCTQHSQRAFGRPDVWVGPPGGAKGKPTRSWRPKQSGAVTEQANLHDDDAASFCTVSTPLTQHRSRGYGRPDGWVGSPSGAKENPTRSWKPKQSTVITNQESLNGDDDAASFYSVASSVTGHSQRAFGRPDGWVGAQSGVNGKPTRSWKPKQSREIMKLESLHDHADGERVVGGRIHAKPAEFQTNGDDDDHHHSAKGEGSFLIGGDGITDDFGEFNGSALCDSLCEIVISTSAKQCLDTSSHSIMTEDSRSRFSEAMEMWHSAASMDFKHDGVSNRTKFDGPMVEVSSPFKRSSRKRDDWISATTRTEQEEASGTRDVFNHPQALPSGLANRGNFGKAQTQQSMSSTSSRTELSNSGHSKVDREEAVPSLDDSVVSLSHHHLDDSHHSFKTCVTSLSTQSYSGGERTPSHQSSRSDERGPHTLPMISWKPRSPSKQGGIGRGTNQSSPVGPKSNHALRAHNRPDTWVGGPRGKLAKRSWKVKKIVEASEMPSDDDDDK
jgi:hypothetical protein